MSTLSINKKKTLRMPIGGEDQRLIQERADFYGISSAQMVSVLEDMQVLLQLPVKTTTTADKDTSVTLEDFWRIPVQPWITKPLDFQGNASLKEVATHICLQFNADFEKIIEPPSMDLLWCSYLLKNWDYEKCGIIHLDKDVNGKFLGGEGNHRRLVLAVGYLSGQLPHIPLHAIVPFTRIDALDIAELLSYTNGIAKGTMQRWAEGDPPVLNVQRRISA